MAKTLRSGMNPGYHLIIRLRLRVQQLKKLIKLWVSHLIHQETCEWNKDLIQELLPDQLKDILTLRPSKHGGAGKWAWLPTSSGVYSTRSGYYEALNAAAGSDLIESASTEEYNWKSKIWDLKTSPKVKLLLWKAMKRALPVGENLKHRNILSNVLCSHCGEEESIVYLFFTCSFAKQIWQNFPGHITLRSDQVSSFRAGFESSLHGFSGLCGLPETKEYSRTDTCNLLI